VKYHTFPTTGTSQIATVIDGQSQVSYPRLRDRLSPWRWILLVQQPRTLAVVAVPVGAVRYRPTQVFRHLGLKDVAQRLHLQVADALWQPGLALTGIA